MFYVYEVIFDLIIKLYKILKCYVKIWIKKNIYIGGGGVIRFIIINYGIIINFFKYLINIFFLVMKLYIYR